MSDENQIYEVTFQSLREVLPFSVNCKSCTPENWVDFEKIFASKLYHRKFNYATLVRVHETEHYENLLALPKD